MYSSNKTVCAANGQEFFPSGTTTSWTDGLAVGWHHIAIVRLGTGWTVYVDGVSRLVSSVADTTPQSLVSSACYVNWDGTYYSAQRWVSDLRISKMARYTANFTPPTAKFDITTDPNASSVATQCGFHQNYDSFDATYRSIWYANGGVSLDTTVKKFGSASLLFDGTTGYLSSYNSPDWYWTQSTPWTIDVWINPKATQTPYPAFFSCPNNNSSNEFPVLLCFSSNGAPTGTAGYVIGLNCFGTAWSTITNGTSALTPNTWNHVEAGFDGTTAYLFLNGALVASGAWTQYPLNWDTTAPWTIGKNYNTSGNISYFQGWIQEFCVTKGVCRHTAAFTPPTAPYDLTTDSYASNITCLIHGTQLPTNTVTILDDVPVYGGNWTAFALNDLAPVYQTGKTWSSTTGNLSDNSAAQTIISWSNARYIQDTTDTRASTAYLIDPKAYEGFIRGICVVQGNPLAGCVLELSRNDDFTPIARTGTGADGLYQFDNLQLDVKSGFYAITARPDPLILNENAQIYKMLDATDYRISTTGAFTYATGTTTVDSTVQIVGNAAPFTVTVASGTLPPGAVVSVSGRNISITGATALTGDYIFDLQITGSIRDYSSTIHFELTPTGIMSMGSNIGYEGENFWLQKQSALLVAMDFSNFSSPTPWNPTIKNLPSFSPGNNPSMSQAQYKVGNGSLALNPGGSPGNAYLYSNSAITFPTTTVTIEAWIFLSSLKNYNVLLNGTDYEGFQIAIPASGQIYFWNGSQTILSSNTALAASTWYHVAFTRNSNNLCTMWINGQADATVTSNLSLNVNSASDMINIGIDAPHSGNGYFNGYINNLCIWNACIYNAPFTPSTQPFYPNLIVPLYP